MQKHHSRQNHEKEKSFQEYENKYNRLINLMPDAYTLWETICNDQGHPVDYRLLEASPAFEPVAGTKTKIQPGRTLLETLPQTEPGLIEKYGKVSRSDESIHFEIFNLKTDRYYDVMAIRAAPNQIASFFTDITERNRAEQLLKESEEHFRSIVRNSEAGYFFIDKDGIIQDVNLAWVKLYRFDSADEILGQHFTVIQQIDDLEAAKEFVAGIIRNDKRYLNGEFSRKCKDGSIGYHSFSARPVSRSGKVIGIEGFIVDTTDRKLSEKHLIESERRYRALFENMNTGFILFEVVQDDNGLPADLIILAANKKFEEITGLKLQDVTGKRLTQELPGIENDAADWIGTYGKVALTGNSIQFEQESELLGYYFTINAYQSGPKQCAVTFLDITKRKRAEAALRLSEDQFRSIVDSSPSAINFYRLDPDEQLVFIGANPSFDRILNVSHKNFMGKTIDEIFPNLITTEIPQMYRNVALGKIGPQAFERAYQDKRVKGYYTVTVFQTAPRTIAVEFFDISERKQTELELATEKERLSVTLRSIGDGVITTDTRGQIVMLNKAAEELTGWDSGDAAGRPLPEIFNIINERTRRKCENPVERVLTTGGIVELENHTCLITKDGREIIIADSGAPIHDSESRIIGVVLVFRDMTEKQRLDASMQKTQKLESLGILAGGIAHDFNNLLTAIFGYIELAIEETKDENVSTCLSESLSNIERARALTQQLLTFAKGGSPVKKIQNLFPFVQQTAQFALSGSSVSSKFRIQESLWPCDFDKNQMGQVIDNLTINAQQAMPNGGTIEISARNIFLDVKDHISLATGNYVKLSIKDQGIGIPKEFLPRIFDPYYTTKSKGHGLGLSTCYSIINRHEGAIEVESEPGKGSTFHLYLPASIESPSHIADRSTGVHAGSGTFLVMDDEPSVRKLSKRMLESFGYKVVVKENGNDAIDFVRKEIKSNRELAGMIFDLTIPGGIGGKEAIEKIREICPITPAFVASGYSEDPIMANPDRYGFNASIRKPFTKSELSEMLDNHLKK